MNALIGHTGFVGSNIKNKFSFNDFYNSKNIEDMKGKKYDLVISAATPALRWKANADPDQDWASIQKLITTLSHVKAKHFILISTIDVYPNKNKVNEESLISKKHLIEPYGKHRYELEEFVRNYFSNHTILRCPQIYGDNMTKGFIYDLLHNNALDFTHKDSMLQFYNVSNFGKDIRTALDNKIHLLNLAVEPTIASEVALHATGESFTTITNKTPLIFDMRTKYAHIYNKTGNYIYDKKETLSQIKKLFL